MLTKSVLIFLAVYFVGANSYYLPNTTVFYSNWAPVYTSFNKNGTVDISVVPAYAKFLSESGITVVHILGVVGEGASLNLCDRKIYVKAWLEAGKKYNLIMVVNIGELRTRDTYSFTKFCYKYGARGVATTLPLFYLKNTANEIVNDLEPIAKLTPKSCFFYEYIPNYTGAHVDARQIHLAMTKRVPNYCGILASLCTCLQIRGQRLLKKNQICVVTNYVAINAAWVLRFNATVNPATSIFPGTANQISNNVTKGNYYAARTNQINLNKCISSVSVPQNGSYEYVDVPDTKYLANDVYENAPKYFNVGKTRPPLDYPSYQTQQEIDEIYKKCVNKYDLS